MIGLRRKLRRGRGGMRSRDVRGRDDIGERGGDWW